MKPVKKILSVATVTALLFILSCSGGQTTDKGTKKDSTKTIPPGCNLDTPIVFSPILPHDVDVTLQNGYNGLTPTIQPCFDLFSWRSFIALNWPADSKGFPLHGNFTDYADSDRVWEYYKDPGEVFQTEEQLLAFSGPYKKEHGIKEFHMFTKASHDLPLPAAILQATGQPVIDKNLNFALYEINMNTDEVNYIQSNGLNTTDGQEKFKDKKGAIFFPEGKNGGPVGAIEIKTTWKVLVQGVDSFNTFYKKRAIIYVSASQSLSHKPLYLKEWVGLVAMHIMHKTYTPKPPFWIWTTFEHMNNAPEWKDRKTTANKYSFFNPMCTTCPVDTAPLPLLGGGYLWDSVKPYAKKYAINGIYGTQVVRQYPVYAPTDTVNKQWQKKLKAEGSVFANYRLIGSQWSATTDFQKMDTLPAPDTLANTVLETYIQSGSCTMTCHKSATDAVKQKSDFSFLLGLAKSSVYLEELKKKYRIPTTKKK
ncbi:MAG: hypothetical protein ACHQRM_17395 [Bacteroidia bacterium]